MAAARTKMSHIPATLAAAVLLVETGAANSNQPSTTIFPPTPNVAARASASGASAASAGCGFPFSDPSGTSTVTLEGGSGYIYNEQATIAWEGPTGRWSVTEQSSTGSTRYRHSFYDPTGSVNRTFEVVYEINPDPLPVCCPLWEDCDVPCVCSVNGNPVEDRFVRSAADCPGGNVSTVASVLDGLRGEPISCTSYEGNYFSSFFYGLIRIDGPFDPDIIERELLRVDPDADVGCLCSGVNRLGDIRVGRSTMELWGSSQVEGGRLYNSTCTVDRDPTDEQECVIVDRTVRTFFADFVETQTLAFRNVARGADPLPGWTWDIPGVCFGK